jgi:ribosome maturation factor RimP
VRRVRVVDVVKELVLPIIQEHRLELVDIEFIKEGQDWFLRVYIDKEGGVTLDDCQLVSEFLSCQLDDVNPIEQSYYLEVSSPGLDRPLKTEQDFEKYKGRKIEVYLYQSLEGKKVIEGELLGLRETDVVVRTHDNKEIQISRDKISKIKLAVII